MPVDLFTLSGTVAVETRSAEQNLKRVDDGAKKTANNLDAAEAAAGRLSRGLSTFKTQSLAAVDGEVSNLAARIPLIGQPLAAATRELFNLGVTSKQSLGSVTEGAAGVSKALSSVEPEAASAASGIGLVGVAAGAAVAGVAALVGVAAGAAYLFDKSISIYSEYAGSLHDIGQESGLTAPTLSTVGAFARLAGVDIRQAASAIDIYLKNVSEAANENKTLAATFERFGIKAKEALKDPDKATQQLFDHLAAIQNPAERMDAAFKLAGKSGKVLASIAQEMGGSFAEAQRQAAEWGVVLSEDDVDAADKFGDSWDILKMKAEGAAYSIAREALPELTKAIDDVSAALGSNVSNWDTWAEGAALAVARVRGVFEGAARWWNGNTWSPWALGKDIEIGADSAALGYMTDRELRLSRPPAEKPPQSHGNYHVSGGGGHKGGGKHKQAKDLTSLYEQLSGAEAGRRLASAAFDVTKFKAGLDAEETILEQSLRAQTVSVADYWNARQRITVAGIDNEIDHLKTERAEAARAFSDKQIAIGSDKKAGAEEKALKLRIEAAHWQEKDLQLQGQIAEATEKRAAVLKTLPMEAQAAARELAKTMSGLRADFLDSQFDLTEATKVRVADKYKDFELLAKANAALYPDAEKWVEALKRADILAANLSHTLESVDLSKGYLSLESAEIQDKISRSVISERKGRREIYELEVKYQRVLLGTLNEALAIAKARGDEKAILSIKQQIEEAEKLGHVVDETRAKARGIFEGAFSHGLEELKGGLKHAAATFGVDLLDGIKRAADARLTKVLSEALFGKNDEFGTNGGLIGKALNRIGLGGFFGGKGKQQADPTAQITTAVEKSAKETEQGVTAEVRNTSADNLGNRDWNTDRIIDALHQLDQTMESMRPQQQGFFKGLLGAALGGFVSGAAGALAGKIFGGGGADESGGPTSGSNRNADGSPILTDRNGTQVSPHIRPRTVTGHALGSYISGPGTSTSDSILARLSNGEYVLRASAVRRIGITALDYINATGRFPRGFAGGGQPGRSYVPPPVNFDDARRPGDGGHGDVRVYVNVHPDKQGRVRSTAQIQTEIYQTSSEAARRNS